jgi:hypothetical protein
MREIAITDTAEFRVIYVAAQCRSEEVFRKDKTAVAATGTPMYAAGRKVVKMSVLLI